MGHVVDSLDRSLSNLRLSVTDRCNLRCAYCMPEREYVWLPREDILTFEEAARLVDVFLAMGVDRVRLTGGEPLLRRDLDRLISMIATKPGLSDLAMTTNGVLLGEMAQRLRDAGLGRVTVSLDTLRTERFQRLTGRDELGRVLAGIDALGEAGFTDTKIDAVVLRGVNDDEPIDLLDYGRRVGAQVRFIEYMDVGGATDWSLDRVVPGREVLERIARERGPIEALPRDSAPAARYRCEDGTVFGLIASTTAPFCGSCDRSRLTSDGTWFLCLYAKRGVDLRTPLREGATTEQLLSLIGDTWRTRDDRGAELRLAEERRGPLAEVGELRSDPKLEMHTRGG